MIFEISETTTTIITKQIEANNALEAEEKTKNNDGAVIASRRQINVNVQEKSKAVTNPPIKRPNSLPLPANSMVRTGR